MSLRTALTRTLLVVAAFTLTACGGDDTAAPEDAPLTPEEERALFIDALVKAQAIPDPPTPSNEEAAVGLGEAICGMFDEGATFEIVATELQNTGTPDPGTWIGTSVGGLCPEHLDKIPN